MKQKLLFLLRYYLYWIILSVVAKIIFLLYQGGEAFGLNGNDYFQIFFRGLRLDLSLGGYILMLSCVMMAGSVFLREKIIRNLFSGLTLLLLIFFSLVVTVDLELFKNWGFHMDTTPLLYLKTPKQALASTPGSLIFGLIVLMIAFIVGGWYLYRWMVLKHFHYKQSPWWQIPVFLVIGGAMIIPVRGGFNVAPMNRSFVFFHPDSMFANQAAINPVWNFMYELMHLNRFKADFNFMPQEKAEQVVDSLMQAGKQYPSVLKDRRPNIVFLLLESFSANAIESLGGVPGVTPNLDTLAKEGILFSDIYATSTRSDRGILAAVSGFPSHPKVAMVAYPSKTNAYPRLSKDLEEAGYTTRFYYAGDINFGGFRSYITMNFQSMVTEDDFTGEVATHRSKWGIHDEYTYERLFQDLSQAPRPFFYMMFNLDSHEPFEVPIPTKIPGDDITHRFLNSIWYVDSCIGDFVRKCKDTGIWENTLFVLMADHGTVHIGNAGPSESKMYRIPLILTGGALNVKDTVISVIGSQTDLVSTLLAQLGLDHSAYKYSRNLLAEDVLPFAFFSYPEGAQVMSGYGNSLYNFQSKKFVRTDSLHRNDEALKAYLQSIHHDVSR